MITNSGSVALLGLGDEELRSADGKQHHRVGQI